MLTSISGVGFAEAWEKRIEAEFDGLLMLFIDKRALHANKAATGRSKDLSDLDALA